MLNIIRLPQPSEVEISFYIVSDNPKASIPESIAALNASGKISLIVHSENLGPAAARNTGIRAGRGKWILFLDDDIRPQEDLLLQYAEAIQKNQTSLGFVGLTIFPAPFNAVTKALFIGGWVSHFTKAAEQSGMKWAPTANVLLNRHKMDPRLFDEAFRKSGEDIEFLVRNSLLSGEFYLSLPAAVVFHPWWDQGSPQTKRMFRYGEGASEIARSALINAFTFRDFTNTAETVLLLMVLSPLALALGMGKWLIVSFLVLVLSEYLTNWLRVILVGKNFSPRIAFHVMWAKNAYEGGFLFRSLQTRYWNGFARRIDMGFQKMHPGAFRTNRWKIIKMILIAVLFSVAVIAI